MIPSEINILVGLQWGSEGRESLIKFLAETSDVCVRFQGCANDGLTLTAAETDMEINYLPAGIAREGTTSLICGDCLIDLGPTVGEIKRALKSGLLKSVLTLDEHCHLIFDFHKKEDALETPVIWQGVGSTGFGGLNNFR